MYGFCQYLSLDNLSNFIFLQESFIHFLRMWKAISKGGCFHQKEVHLEDFSRGPTGMGKGAAD